MSDFIFLILFILGLALIPYRKIYTRLNQRIDGATLLKGLVMIAFPFIWMLFSPEITDAASENKNFIANLSASMGSFAVMISWLIAVAGLVMIGFAVWTASEHQEEMKKLHEKK